MTSELTGRIFIFKEMLGGILRAGGTVATGNRAQFVIPEPIPAQVIEADIQQTMTEQPIPEFASLRLATLNIIDGRRNRLNAALRCMKQMNVDIGLLTETKLSNDRYTKSAEGYRVEGTKADIGKGGIALVYRDSKAWGLESTRTYGPNVIKTTLVSGQRRWYIIGAYIPPSEIDGATLDCIQQAKDAANNSRWPTIMLGDFNVDIEKPEGNSNEGVERRLETAALLSSMGMRSIRASFRQCEKRLGRYWTWKKRRNGVVHGAILDHILADSRRDFINCQLKKPRFDTDHMLLLGTMRLGQVKHHRRYVRARGTYPIKPVEPMEGNRADALLQDLEEAAKAEKMQGDRTGRSNSWITPLSWRLIDQKTAARSNGYNLLARDLAKKVRKSLKQDRRARARRAANAAQEHLDKGEIREAFGCIKGWYREAGPKPPKPSRTELNLTGAEYANLYAEEAPAVDPIPIHVGEFDIDDAPPSEAEVRRALMKLKNNRAAGASGITVENLKEWESLARPPIPKEGQEAVEPDRNALVLWMKVLEVVRLAFVEGEIPRKFSEGILVLIPKSSPGEYRGIALLEIIYKLLSSIINRRLCDKVKLDDALHGFRAKRGTGTAIMEVKLLAQLRSRSDEPLFMIFLDLKKAYDTLDRTQAMRILKGYGVGRNIRRIIDTIWRGDTMVPRQSGYFGRPFRAKRGVRQGDIVSPFIFNIMVDAVVRHWRHEIQPSAEELALFYADDGVISGTDEARVQGSLDHMTRSFRSLGLKMNAVKTESMVMCGGKNKNRLSSAAYDRLQTGIGPSHRERQATKVTCWKCGGLVARGYLKRHQLTAKCKKACLTYQPPTPVRERVAAEQRVTPVGESVAYSINIPTRHNDDVQCPVVGCRYQVAANCKAKRLGMRRHFRQRHIMDTIVIEEEGQLPQCRWCGLFGRNVLNESHTESNDCSDFSVKRKRFYRAIRQESAKDVEFNVGGQVLKKSRQFRYLGRILDDEDDDNHAALRQLARAREKWGRIGRVLQSEGVSPRVMGYFYKAIVQAVLLYGSESWTVSETIIKQFRSFHARVARYLCKRHIRQLPDGTWNCPPTAEVLNDAGLESIDEYIRRRRATVREYIRGRPIYEACKRSRALSTNVNKILWWHLD